MLSLINLTSYMHEMVAMINRTSVLYIVINKY